MEHEASRASPLELADHASTQTSQESLFRSRKGGHVHRIRTETLKRVNPFRFRRHPDPEPMVEQELYAWPLPPAPESKISQTWYDALVQDIAPTLAVTLLHPEATPPARGKHREGWALHVSPGFKFDQHPIHSNQRVSIPTGLRVVVPDGYVGVVLPLEELRLKERLEANVDYMFPKTSGELWIRLGNKGKTKRCVHPNMKIAHFILLKTEEHVKVEVTNPWAA